MDKTLSIYLGYHSLFYAALFVIILLVVPISVGVVIGYSFNLVSIIVIDCGLLSFYFLKGAEKLRRFIEDAKKGKVLVL